MESETGVMARVMLRPADVFCQTIHQRIVDALKHEITVLILADELYVIIQRTRHGQLRKGRNKIVNSAVAGTLGNTVEHVEDQAAADAGDGGTKGKTHAAQQVRNALDELGGIRKVQGRQTT